jgi:hypothetical protein
MITYGVFMELVGTAEKMGCKVIFDSKKKISFKPDMTITVPLSTTLENAYALAHEIGHLMDFLQDDLEYDTWLHDMSYRVTKEMSAWVHAYKVLKELGIPLESYHEHVDSKLSTYFKYHEVIA